MTRCPFLRTVALSVIWAFSSCYTYEETSKDELTAGFPMPELTARITLKDGSSINSPEHTHVLTNEPTSLITGVGQDRSKLTPFKGVLLSSDLDSTKQVSNSEGVFLVCWLKNKTSLAFKEGQYLAITMQDEPGFWCAGQRTATDQTARFRGRLAQDQIDRVEVRKFDYETVAYVVAPVAAFFLVIEAFRGKGRKIF